jgi:SpoIID/LytB domain protein
MSAAPPGGGEYRGAIEVRRSAGGVGVVNDVGLEDYLKGISEVPSSWPAEALRAQAIAARTFALHTLQTGTTGSAAQLGAQICATEGCQVYAGLVKERAPGGANWAAAVDATRGLVVLHQGRPILAKYSSSNGGTTVSGGRPYLKPVPDPDDAASPLHRWHLDVSFDDLGRALALTGPVRDVRTEGAAVIASWEPPGGGRQELRVTPVQFRAKVNAAVPPPAGRTRTVPSPMFTATADGGARMLSIAGRGYGHGIGMSQYGMLGKARRGMKAPAILTAYYPGTKVAPIPAGQVPPGLRVAVEPGRSEATVSASGPFRMFDEKGQQVAAIGTGSWRIVPAGKTGIRVLAPPEQVAVPRFVGAVVEPAEPQPGQPVTLKFKTTAPAFVRVVSRAPGGADAEVFPAKPVEGGEVAVPMPPAAKTGAYLVSMSVDSGGGRSSSLMLMPMVLAPADARLVDPWVRPGTRKPGAALAHGLKSRVAAGKAAAVDGGGGGGVPVGLLVTAGVAVAGLGVGVRWRRRGGVEVKGQVKAKAR